MVFTLKKQEHYLTNLVERPLKLLHVIMQKMGQIRL